MIATVLLCGGRQTKTVLQRVSCSGVDGVLRYRDACAVMPGSLSLMLPNDLPRDVIYELFSMFCKPVDLRLQ